MFSADGDGSFDRVHNRSTMDDKMLAQLKSWFDLAEIGNLVRPLPIVTVDDGHSAGWVVHHVLLKFPLWAIQICVGCLVAVVLLFVYAFLWFMHKNPDVLRRELSFVEDGD